MDRQITLISLEFNELCPNLLNQFMDSGELPNFSRLRAESEVFVTDAEESGELLNPWVQWVTVHTGQAAQDHKVTSLSEGHLVRAPAIWDLVTAAQGRVWVCGSMNCRYDRPLNGYLLPDPWSTGVLAFPEEEFTNYLAFVRGAVQDHTSGGSGGGSALDFLKFMAKHGLSASTVCSVLAQIASEKFGDNKWKRAAILDLLQWDLFRHYYRKSRPNLATFFINSTAHFQHCYWRNMEPEKFQAKPTDSEQKTYSRAILFGYKKMDGLVGKFLRLASDPNTIILFSTALSQQPYLDHENRGGRRLYHLITPAALQSHLGMDPTIRYEAVMAEQFYLRFNSVEAKMAAEKHLAGYRVPHPDVFPDERNRLFNINPKDRSLIVQCRCTSKVPTEARIIHDDDPTVSIPFYDVFYEMPSLKSGRHHPDGVLWIRNKNRQHRIHHGKPSIRAIAPTILTLLGIPIPPTMTVPPLVAARES